MGQQKDFASKYDLRRLGSTARMWEKEGAEDGAEGFLSRRCGGGGGGGGTLWTREYHV